MRNFYKTKVFKKLSAKLKKIDRWDLVEELSNVVHQARIMASNDAYDRMRRSI